MGEIVERVARAIWGPYGQIQEWQIQTARHAIEVLMEPTEAMMHAADHFHGLSKKQIWQAMLKEVLHD